MTHLELVGYMRAIDDMREALSNANENQGGIHFGDLFIERAHWDHELRDLLDQMEEDARRS